MGRLMDLIERFVRAHERTAIATEDLASVHRASLEVARSNLVANQRMAGAVDAKVTLETLDLVPVTEAIQGLRDVISALRGLFATPNESDSHNKETSK